MYPASNTLGRVSFKIVHFTPPIQKLFLDPSLLFPYFPSLSYPVFDFQSSIIFHDFLRVRFSYWLPLNVFMDQVFLQALKNILPDMTCHRQFPFEAHLFHYRQVLLFVVDFFSRWYVVLKHAFIIHLLFFFSILLVSLCSIKYPLQSIRQKKNRGCFNFFIFNSAFVAM